MLGEGGGWMVDRAVRRFAGRGAVRAVLRAAAIYLQRCGRARAMPHRADAAVAALGQWRVRGVGAVGSVAAREDEKKEETNPGGGGRAGWGEGRQARCCSCCAPTPPSFGCA